MLQTLDFWLYIALNPCNIKFFACCYTFLDFWLYIALNPCNIKKNRDVTKFVKIYKKMAIYSLVTFVTSNFS